MDLVIVAICGNCAISIGCLTLTLWIIRCRRQIVAIKNCCDRWTIDGDLLLDQVPAAISTTRAQIHSLEQIYQQQLITLARLRALRLLLTLIRSLYLARA